MRKPEGQRCADILGIDKMTTKVCNTAIRLAKYDHKIPLNRFDQAIAMNFARSEQVVHDLNRILSEKLNSGWIFRYPETFRYDQVRKKGLVTREAPADKKVALNINYAMGAVYAQGNFDERWSIVINHEWFELSTETVFELEPELLPPNSEYGTTVGL